MSNMIIAATSVIILEVLNTVTGKVLSSDMVFAFPFLIFIALELYWQHKALSVLVAASIGAIENVEEVKDE